MTTEEIENDTPTARHYEQKAEMVADKIADLEDQLGKLRAKYYGYKLQADMSREMKRLENEGAK